MALKGVQHALILKRAQQAGPPGNGRRTISTCWPMALLLAAPSTPLPLR
jgi:hypothetical protein